MYGRPPVRAPSPAISFLLTAVANIGFRRRAQVTPSTEPFVADGHVIPSGPAPRWS